MFEIHHNIPQIKDKLLRLRKLVGKPPNWQTDMVGVAEQAVRDLKRLTPRSKEGSKGKWAEVGRGGGKVWKEGKHVADGWKLRHIGRSGKDRVPVITAVWNDLTHKWTKDGLTPRPRALLRTAGGVTKKYTLLEVLEYGSPPHGIDPVKASVLRFQIGGETIFTKHVDHPGTRPIGMVRTTRAKTKIRLMKMGRRWLRKLQDEWKRG